MLNQLFNSQSNIIYSKTKMKITRREFFLRSAGAIVVVSSSGICTHNNCTISEFDGSNNVFVCLCHGSQFDLNGNVKQGPATTKLRSYNTRVENNSLIITL